MIVTLEAVIQLSRRYHEKKDHMGIFYLYVASGRDKSWWNRVLFSRCLTWLCYIVVHHESNVDFFTTTQWFFTALWFIVMTPQSFPWAWATSSWNRVSLWLHRGILKKSHYKTVLPWKFSPGRSVIEMLFSTQFQIIKFARLILVGTARTTEFVESVLVIVRMIPQIDFNYQMQQPPQLFRLEQDQCPGSNHLLQELVYLMNKSSRIFSSGQALRQKQNKINLLFFSG